MFDIDNNITDIEKVLKLLDKKGILSDFTISSIKVVKPTTEPFRGEYGPKVDVNITFKNKGFDVINLQFSSTRHQCGIVEMANIHMSDHMETMLLIGNIVAKLCGYTLIMLTNNKISTRDKVAKEIIEKKWGYKRIFEFKNYRSNEDCFVCVYSLEDYWDNNLDKFIKVQDDIQERSYSEDDEDCDDTDEQMKNWLDNFDDDTLIKLLCENTPLEQTLKSSSKTKKQASLFPQ